MKNTRVFYKEEAKLKMVGRYGDVILYLLATGIVTGIITAISDNFRATVENGVIVDPGNPTLLSLFSIISFLIASAFAYSTISVFIDVADNNEINVLDKLKSGFVNQYGRNIILVFMQQLFTFLWALLLIIPGIIKAYAYSMAMYIANKEPGIDGLAAISKSKEMTRGHKSDLFMLDLSYLGWYILGIFTFGILWLWVIPKHFTARTFYYNEIYYGSHDFDSEAKVDAEEEPLL